jgi:hypothetical protein
MKSKGLMELPDYALLWQGLKLANLQRVAFGFPQKFPQIAPKAEGLPACLFRGSDFI